MSFRLFVVLFWASSQQCDQMYEVMVDLAKNSALSNVTFVKVSVFGYWLNFTCGPMYLSQVFCETLG